MARAFRFLLLLLVAGTVTADAAFSNASSTTDGPHSCGGVPVPYPFGVREQDGTGDFRKGFAVNCTAGKLTRGGFPFGDFSIQKAEARVWLPIAWECLNSTGGYRAWSHLILRFNDTGVFRYSYAKNYIFVLGCNTLGFLRGGRQGPQPIQTTPNMTIIYTEFTGCIGYCNDYNSAVNGVCSGVGCCHSELPDDVFVNSLHFRSVFNNTNALSFSPCSYAFLAEKDYYTFNTADLNMDLQQTPRLMPVTIDWAIRDNLTCEQAIKDKTYACASNSSRCLDSTNGPGYICSCSDGYEGNPYIADGCTDINECEHPDDYPCQGNCLNKQGSYDCICPKYSRSSDAKTKPCDQIFPLKWRIIVGALVVFFIAAILVFIILLIGQKKKMHDYYKKNGGPALEKLSTLKLYKKEDIRKIQKSCNVIGQGGFGKVYKGCIGDDIRLVAVKETINVSSEHNDQFANEISIQSQVIHKNIVKLLGCCLQVDSPILVYEFVPKGSLDVILHGDRSIPLSLSQRLQIAAESAEGLAYMHSKANVTILHGDVKPANILINDDYIPKISDFGISRLMATDKEHTALIIGDRNYMDPVYFQTGLLTNKSDVYSFGVVLLELITRKKASHSNQNELLRKFNEAYEKNKSMIELVDNELSEADPRLLNSLAEMIHECLSLDVNERPDMTDLEVRLRDMVKRCHITEL